MKLKLSLCIFMKLLCSTLGQRPFWNMGHMVNSAIQVEEFLGYGANAIESDVTFDDKGNPIHTYHGVPCDCGRSCTYEEHIDSYMEHIEEVTNPKNAKYQSQFLLQMFDLKISRLKYEAKERAIQQLLEKIVRIFMHSGQFESQLQFLFSIPKSADIKLVAVAHETLTKLKAEKLKERIGWDVYSYEEIAEIGATFRAMNLTNQIWQGDGITNCLPRNAKRLQEAIRMRDAEDLKLRYNSKVYFWTIDMKASMRKSLRLEVDAIMTNYPARLKEILQEPEFSSKFRLATANDSFWTRYDSPEGPKRQRLENIEVIEGYNPENSNYF